MAPAIRMGVQGDSGCHALSRSPGILAVLRALCPTSGRASHFVHVPHSSWVSSASPLQTYLGLGLKTPTQSAHLQQLWPRPSLDICGWGGCCPFSFLWHTGVVFLKARIELGRSFRKRDRVLQSSRPAKSLGPLRP